MKATLTAERLRELLHYDPETGVFTWKIRPSKKRILAGDRAGSMHNEGYIEIGLERRSYLAHRLAWLYVTGSWPKYTIDHFNGDRTDNRLANLRDATYTINNQNERAARKNNKSSGLLGVSRDKKSWNAHILADGKSHNLGYFATPEEAHQAYLAAKRRLHEGCTI